MLPSEFPEVQAHKHLKQLLVAHVNMQVEDIRAMLRLPIGDIEGGCNFAATAFIFNIIGGSSVCFYPGERGGADRAERTGPAFPRVTEGLLPVDGRALLP